MGRKKYSYRKRVFWSLLVEFGAAVAGWFMSPVVVAVLSIFFFGSLIGFVLETDGVSNAVSKRILPRIKRLGKIWRSLLYTLLVVLAVSAASLWAVWFESFLWSLGRYGERQGNRYVRVISADSNDLLLEFGSYWQKAAVNKIGVAVQGRIDALSCRRWVGPPHLTELDSCVPDSSGFTQGPDSVGGFFWIKEIDRIYATPELNYYVDVRGDSLVTLMDCVWNSWKDGEVSIDARTLELVKSKGGTFKRGTSVWRSWYPVSALVFLLFSLDIRRKYLVRLWQTWS